MWDLASLTYYGAMDRMRTGLDELALGRHLTRLGVDEERSHHR